MSTETQRTISDWGLETFGPRSALDVATRMNIEVVELLCKLQEATIQDEELEALLREHGKAAERICSRANELLEKWGDAMRAPFYPKHLPGVHSEIADVLVVLHQVATLSGLWDIHDAVDRKMVINRRRAWAKTPAGRFQHTSQE